MPCSGWESKTRQIWNILKPQSKTCLYCSSLPSQRKYKQQTDKFKLLFFPTYPQQNGKRCSIPQKRNFYLNSAAVFRETAGLQLCLHLAHGAEMHYRGQGPLGSSKARQCTLCSCRATSPETCSTALPFSFQNKTGGRGPSQRIWHGHDSSLPAPHSHQVWVLQIC